MMGRVCDCSGVRGGVSDMVVVGLSGSLIWGGRR